MTAIRESLEIEPGPRPTRVAVIDIGTNSTRLLVADVHAGLVEEVDRRTRVTRLGRGVDSSGQLSPDAIDEVCDTVDEYIAAYRTLDVERVVAVATSAVRDASNSGAFRAELRERFALDSRILDGEEEARLTYLGASSQREPADHTLVIDIGGGSTELILGSDSDVDFYASLQCGVVRHTERYLTEDPPTVAQLESLSGDVRELLDAELTGRAHVSASEGIAVAGTPTSLAAIDLRLEPYDGKVVHGYRLPLGSVQRMCSQLATVPLEERRRITGLHPGRAPTIVAGVIILIQVMRAFGLSDVEVSEHDILYGAALEAAKTPA